MEEIGNLMQGFAVALTFKNLLFMLIGILLGVLIGVLPGLGGANGVAILLPLTFTMPPTSAIIMLSCIYWGALFGGAITSILFNIPGEPWSVATTFDGYPMAQQGRAGEAMTATRKLTPRNSSDEPKVMRNWPDTVSMPMPASSRPSDIEMTVLCLASRPRPTNEQKVKRYTAKNSGGPNFSANDEIIGARKVISITATSEPMNDEVKAAVNASAALPCCAIG